MAINSHLYSLYYTQRCPTLPTEGRKFAPIARTASGARLSVFNSNGLLNSFALSCFAE